MRPAQSHPGPVARGLWPAGFVGWPEVGLSPSDTALAASNHFLTGGQGGPHTAPDTAKRSSLQPSLESALSLWRGSRTHVDLPPASGELGGSVGGEGSGRRRAQSGCGEAENASRAGLGQLFWGRHLPMENGTKVQGGVGESRGWRRRVRLWIGRKSGIRVRGVAGAPHFLRAQSQTCRGARLAILPGPGPAGGAG